MDKPEDGVSVSVNDKNVDYSAKPLKVCQDYFYCIKNPL